MHTLKRDSKLSSPRGGHDLHDLRFRPDTFALLHCVSQYPTHPHEVNLMRMVDMHHKFPNPRWGFSSHINPLHPCWIDPLKMALAMGVNIIEVHFTTSPRGETKDGYVSLNYSQLKELCLFDRMSLKEKLAGNPWLGKYVYPQTQEERDVIKKYKGRWQQ